MALFIINYNDNDGSLFSNDLVALVQALLLWLTWLGALWAARESFDQKNIANKTIKEVRQQNDYEMRPYLRLMWAGDNSDDVIFKLDNKGRGIAKDVVFERLNFIDDGFLSPIQIKSRPLVSPNGSTKITRKEIISLDNNTHYELQ